MFNKKILFIVISVYILLSIGCTSVVSEPGDSALPKPDNNSTPTPEPTRFVIPPEFLNSTADELCNRLGEIKVMPYKDPNDTDPIYEALILKGNASISCLIEKITDKTKMRDPRQAPKWQHFAIGDAAVFILVDIVEKDDEEPEKLLIKMMPQKSQKEWETNGIYAYFNYVSEPKNRKELQTWWKNRLVNNKK